MTSLYNVLSSHPLCFETTFLYIHFCISPTKTEKIFYVNIITWKKNWLYNTYESRTMGYDILFFTHFLETFRLRFYVIHSICNYIFFVSIVLSNGSIHKYTEWQSGSNALYIAVTSLSSFVEWSQNGPSREWWGYI